MHNSFTSLTTTLRTAETGLAMILDRDSQKWVPPTSGQFKISYKLGVFRHGDQPDVVAETADCINMLEAKAKNDMTSPDVLAKKVVAVLWCMRRITQALSNRGKPYDVIIENMTLAGLISQFAISCERFTSNATTGMVICQRSRTSGWTSPMTPTGLFETRMRFGTAF